VNFTFLNTVNKENMKKRLKRRKKLNRYDKFNYNFYKRVQKGFLNIAKKKKKYYQIINSNLDINQNKSTILKKIDSLIK
jgi:dTMP kinase